MNHTPDTELWRELCRLAALKGVQNVSIRAVADEARAVAAPTIIDLMWPGGEVESLRFARSTDPDHIAHALAHELDIQLAAPQQ